MVIIAIVSLPVYCCHCNCFTFCLLQLFHFLFIVIVDHLSLIVLSFLLLCMLYFPMLICVIGYMNEVHVSVCMLHVD